VIQDRQIRRLSSQVKKERVRTLTGRAKNQLEQSTRDRECFEPEDFEVTHSARERRFCKERERELRRSEADVQRVSSERLLAASLTSLQNIGKRVSLGRANNVEEDADCYGEDCDRSRGGEGGDRAFGQSGTFAGSQTLGSRSQYPSASYLRGALWLGRNMTLMSEELAEALDTLRVKHLNEAAEIARDTNATRACHRLSLLTSSGFNQAVTLASKSKGRVREMLEGVAALEPGNASQLQRLLATLPIESALSAASRALTPPRESRLTGQSQLLRESGLLQRTHSAPNSPLGKSRMSSYLGSPLLTADLRR
jgi:hypothetical protein